MDMIKTALELGFTTAAPLCIQTLHPEKSVRDMCAEDRCRSYGRNWTCPPACGTLEECAQRIASYEHGILLQTVGQMEKDIDSKVYRQTAQTHNRLLRAFSDTVRSEYPNALCLGAGGCGFCKVCAWPEPCRFPEKAISSMEGYGLFVTQVCRDNQVPYYHGPRTVTYTACVLY